MAARRAVTGEQALFSQEVDDNERLFIVFNASNEFVFRIKINRKKGVVERARDERNDDKKKSNKKDDKSKFKNNSSF